MLQPRKSKFRKHFKGDIKGSASRGHELAFGSFGLKAIDASWITSRQIEAARIALTRRLKREGKVWIKIFPDKVITKKPAEVRMGKGKGSPEYWVAVVHPGRIMFEVDGVAESDAIDALNLGAQKLPVNCKIVKRKDL